MPSVLWRCWLGGRKGIRPVKTEWWGTGMVICLQRGANDLYIVQLMPLPPHHTLLQWNPEGFNLSGAGIPSLSWKKGCQMDVVVVYVYTSICIALYHDSSLKRSGMARVNKGSHSFTCHPHVYPQVEWTIPAFTPQPQSITALWLLLISRPDEGRRLSWPGWLGEILR